MTLKELYNQLTSEELAEKYQRERDTLAYEVLHDRLLGLAYVLIRKRVFRDSDEREDYIGYQIAQFPEIILRYDPARSASFRTYAVNCILHDLKNYYAHIFRKKYALDRSSVPIETVYGLGMSSGENVEEQALARVVLHELEHRIPRRDREVYKLYYIDGYSTNEIARMMHKSQTAIQYRLKRVKNIIEEVAREWL